MTFLCCEKVLWQSLRLIHWHWMLLKRHVIGFFIVSDFLAFLKSKLPTRRQNKMAM